MYSNIKLLSLMDTLDKVDEMRFEMGHEYHVSVFSTELEPGHVWHRLAQRLGWKQPV